MLIALGGGGGVGGGSDDGGVTGIAWEGGGGVQRTTGKVLFILGSSDYVCSGSAVVDSLSGHSLVLTAGHSVYDDVANALLPTGCSSRPMSTTRGWFGYYRRVGRS